MIEREIAHSEGPVRRGVGWPLGEVILGGLVIGLGIVLFWQLTQMTVGPSYARIGPRLFPGVVATGLIAIGIGIILYALLGADTARPDEFEPFPVLWICAGLVALVVLIERAGFVVAATALFLCVARGFGSHSVLRDLGIAIVLSLTCQFGFSHGLGLRLPLGVLSMLG